MATPAGIKFVHGVEIYLTEQLEPKVRDNYHTVLLAKNEAGIRELNKLVSISSDKAHSYYTNRISFEEFLGILVTVRLPLCFEQDVAAFGFVLGGAMGVCPGHQRDAVLFGKPRQLLIESNLVWVVVRLYLQIVVVAEQPFIPGVILAELIQWTGQTGAGLDDVVRNPQELRGCL